MHSFKQLLAAMLGQYYATIVIIILKIKLIRIQCHITCLYLSYTHILYFAFYYFSFNLTN